MNVIFNDKHSNPQKNELIIQIYYRQIWAPFLNTSHCFPLSPPVSAWKLFLENIMELEHNIGDKDKKTCSLNVFSRSLRCAENAANSLTY